MRAINKKATAIMDKLVEGLNLDTPHRKIDNNEPDSGIMAVSVNYLCHLAAGDIISMAHYYEENGDLMADPDINFLRAGGKYYPLTWRMDGIGVFREYVQFGADGLIKSFEPRGQRETAEFAGGWMQNIKIQQHLWGR